MSHVPRIASVRLAEVGGDLSQQVGNARASWDRRVGWIVGITDDAGRVGLGEAAPLPGMSPDSYDEAGAALSAAAARAAGTELSLGEAPFHAIDTFVRSILQGHTSPSARFALETALLDLSGQALRVPAHRLVPVADLPPRTEGSEAVEVSALLGDLHAPDVVARARALMAEGARTLKVKVGARTIEDDAAAVGALRAALGPEVVLFADANGVWSHDEARAALRAFAPHHLPFVEQPVAPASLASLGPCAIPVWADESLARADTRRAVLEADAVAGLACKPTVVGGFAASLALAHGAATRGKAFAITHALEGPIAMAACAALARALAGLAPRAGLWPHDALGAYAEVEPFMERGRLRPGGGPGLGLLAEGRARLLEIAWPT